MEQSQDTEKKSVIFTLEILSFLDIRGRVRRGPNFRLHKIISNFKYSDQHVVTNCGVSNAKPDSADIKFDLFPAAAEAGRRS